MNLSDILVANYLPNEYMDICIPGKLFEYAVSRKPIIMGARGEARHLIETYNLGLTVTPSDVYEFKDAIINIAYGTFQYKPRTKQFIQDFSLVSVTKYYDQIFKRIS